MCFVQQEILSAAQNLARSPGGSGKDFLQSRKSGGACSKVAMFVIIRSIYLCISGTYKLKHRLMAEQMKKLSFIDQNIYVGIDVHLRSWTVTVLTEHTTHKTFSQPPDPGALAKYLHENFPDAIYHSAYEAGFSGYWAHYELVRLGITNIIINPADIPTTQKEQFQKNDPIDSRKIARALRAKQLTPIHILDKDTIEERSLVRMRNTIVSDMTRCKTRAKAFLNFYGIQIPEELKTTNAYWSRRFIKWLKEDVEFRTPFGRQSLDFLIMEVESQRAILLEINRQIRTLSQGERYRKNIDLLKGIPGIGLISAISIMTQIESIHRFNNTNHLASYVGLIPNCYASGDREVKGEITFRGHRLLKRILVECAWMAIKGDGALSLCFNRYVKRMPPNKAIIRIARKLLNRIYYVLKNEREYECGIV